MFRGIPVIELRTEIYGSIHARVRETSYRFLFFFAFIGKMGMKIVKEK
jgi:hypothetical protein